MAGTARRFPARISTAMSRHSFLVVLLRLNPPGLELSEYMFRRSWP
jgi:hypothetical protein